MTEQFTLSRPVSGWLRATFDRPPPNLLDADTIGELAEIADILATDPELRVVVFDSLNPDFFMARYDLSATPPDPADPFAAGLHAFADVARRIADSPVISIAAIRGRARAIEIVVTGDDYDALTAERYGWVNRAVPDAELDQFVARMARRIASFDRAAVSVAKRLIARRGGVETDLAETISALPGVAAATRDRRAQLRELAQQVGVDFELRLGHHLGPR